MSTIDNSETEETTPVTFPDSSQFFVGHSQTLLMRPSVTAFTLDL